jgi:DNA-binding beta-propeller fold protein YncE
VAVDSAGRFYVSDSYLNVVQVFSDTGKFLYVLGDDGKPRRFDTPTGIALDTDDHLYVVEMLKNRVSVFGIPP